MPVRLLRFRPVRLRPYGYYGPEWFSGGVFIGAGPWFHGAHDFHGHVDNRFDPHQGYAGPHPDRGDKPFNHFHGNEMRDGRGHAEGGGHRLGTASDSKSDAMPICVRQSSEPLPSDALLVIQGPALLNGSLPYGRPSGTTLSWTQSRFSDDSGALLPDCS
jgi:hypothetical protein